jgi:hypothetical protein
VTTEMFRKRRREDSACDTIGLQVQPSEAERNSQID